MRTLLNRKETVLRHASPPSKKRKHAKIGCSSFEDSQHPVASDLWFRWSLCVLCVVFVSFARWCFFCRAHSWILLEMRGANLCPISSCGRARVLVCFCSMRHRGHPRSTRDGCERVTRLADGRLVSVVSS